MQPHPALPERGRAVYDPTSDWPRSQRQRTGNLRRAFTLVELLVVLTIIAILIALLSTAVASAMTLAREARVLSEINGLDMALRNYASDYGPPPDFSPWDGNSWATTEATYGQAVFAKHLLQRFSGGPIFNYANVQTGIASIYGLDVERLDPAEAYVFWLGGFSQGGRLVGFCANKADPLSPAAPRTKPLYDFEETRLLDRDGDGWLEYYPDANVGPPYAYFSGRGDGNYSANAAYVPPFNPGAGAAVPYYLPTGFPVNGDSFQIIAAGVQDNSYQGTFPRPAVPPIWNTGANFTDGDLDNLTNFHSGRLEKGLQ